nr:MAG TPA: hypothetical protein [Caudoviricetes sp.]
MRNSFILSPIVNSNSSPLICCNLIIAQKC